jgi:hypothetical protein
VNSSSDQPRKNSLVRLNGFLDGRIGRAVERSMPRHRDQLKQLVDGHLQLLSQLVQSPGVRVVCAAHQAAQSSLVEAAHREDILKLEPMPRR